MSKAEEIIKYARAHTWSCLHVVHQFLRMFDWNKEAEDTFQKLLYCKEQRAFLDAERKGGDAAEAHRRRVKNIDMEAYKRTHRSQDERIAIVGPCPRCDGWLRGMLMPRCDSKLSNRHFYKECLKCTYYSEIFLKKNIYTEIEGGD